VTQEWQRYSSIGVNFGLTVGVSAYLGFRLDRHWETDPWCTLGLTLFGVFAGMYHLIASIKDINKK